MIKNIIIVLLVFLIAYLLINFTKKTENYSNPTSSALSALPNGKQDQSVSSQYFNLGCDNIQSITHSDFFKMLNTSAEV